MASILTIFTQATSNLNGLSGRSGTGVPKNITPTISPIGSIVKSARIVQSSNVVLTIYYVTISDEQHAELWS